MRVRREHVERAGQEGVIMTVIEDGNTSGMIMHMKQEEWDEFVEWVKGNNTAVDLGLALMRDAEMADVADQE